ncbi:GTP-binding protein Rheb [Ciona intestinalis]|uniref:GTP-binding protein Rheb n=1 Tax=Ciona intestinalis TaxID=7719 RepID=F6S569_CIOIN|nr:GTP-binding protein Rheb [Ciona intestinalis]|eukprot:XP_002128233.1 GTP-binding protein Rheb [Ciona intestinalis]
MPPPRERKLAIMGYRSVGKSSITIQFVDNQFVESYDPTIENTFTRQIKVLNQEYKLNIVDTAGQDEYSLFPVSYSLDIHGYILVYSVTSAKSFEVVKVIYDKLLDMVGRIKIPIVLVGNKTDLHMHRKVTTDEGQKLAQTWNAIFLETSAKDNLDVQEIFKKVILEMERQDGNLPEEKKCIIS